MTYSISEIAKMMKVQPSTLRYYDQMGLFPNIKRVNGRRVFSEEDFKWLRVLKCMKKIILCFISLFLVVVLVGCGTNKTNVPDVPIDDKTPEEVGTMNIKISVNRYALTATLLDNESAKAFYDLVKEGLTLKLSEYGGFEKVGPIGKTLPTNDARITAQPGDLILYAGNQLSIIYGSNTWSYTKLGTVDHLDQIQLASILGSADVTVTFSI